MCLRKLEVISYIFTLMELSKKHGLEMYHGLSIVREHLQLEFMTINGVILKTVDEVDEVITPL